MGRSRWIIVGLAVGTMALSIALGAWVIGWQAGPSVNALLVSAGSDLKAAHEADDNGERVILLRRVDTALARVVDQHPDSDAAVRLATGETIGTLHVGEVRHELYEAEETHCLTVLEYGCLASQMARYAPFLNESFLVPTRARAEYLLRVAEETGAWVAYKAASEEFLAQDFYDRPRHLKIAVAIAKGLIRAADQDRAETLIESFVSDWSYEIRARLAIADGDQETALQHANRLPPEQKVAVLRDIVAEFNADQHLDTMMWLVDHIETPTIQIDILLWLGDRRRDAALHRRAAEVAKHIKLAGVRTDSLFRVAQATTDNGLLNENLAEFVKLDDPASKANNLLEDRYQVE